MRGGKNNSGIHHQTRHSLGGHPCGNAYLHRDERKNMKKRNVCFAEKRKTPRFKDTVKEQIGKVSLISKEIVGLVVGSQSMLVADNRVSSWFPACLGMPQWCSTRRASLRKKFACRGRGNPPPRQRLGRKKSIAMEINKFASCYESSHRRDCGVAGMTANKLFKRCLLDSETRKCKKENKRITDENYKMCSGGNVKVDRECIFHGNFRFVQGAGKHSNCVVN